MANTHSLDLERSSSEFASITDASQTGLDLTGDFTIEAWARVEIDPGTDVIYVFAAKHAGSPNGGYAFRYFRKSDGNRYLHMTVSDTGSSNEDYQSNIIDLGTEEWHHVAVSWDASASTANFYLDSVSVGSDTGSKTSINNNSLAFEIGARTSGTNSFDGEIDEVRVWNDIRTTGEISANYQKEITGAEANLQGYWKLNNNLTDSTSNGNDLTHSGTATYNTDVPFVGSTSPRTVATSRTVATARTVSTARTVATTRTVVS